MQESDAGARPVADPATEPSKTPTEDRDFRTILRALVGKTVMVVNPESYEAAPMGFQLKEGYYSGKIAALGRDYMLFHTVVETSKKEGGKVPVKQYIPMDRIKRVSAMKGTFILHL